MSTRTRRTAIATLAATAALAVVPATGTAATTSTCSDKGYVATGPNGASTYSVNAQGIHAKHYPCSRARSLAVSLSRSWYEHKRFANGWTLVTSPSALPNGGQFLIFERDRRRGATQRLSFAYYSATYPGG